MDQENKETWSHEDFSDRVCLSVQNIGGIDDCEITFDSGVTVLSGENATNRTSVLRALIDVLGGRVATLKSDADEGQVDLEFNNQTYSRRYTRQTGTVSVSGVPLSENRDIVDLFGGLLETNEVRQVVARSDDLRDVIMRPVDVEQIQHDIVELESERDRIDRELEEIEQERSRLPKLEERRGELEDEIADLTAGIEDLQETIDEFGADEEDVNQAESLIEELDDLSKEHTSLEEDIETQRSSIEALRDERTEVEDELRGLTIDESERAELEQEIDRLQTRKRELADLINDLSAIVEVNNDLISSDTASLPGVGDEASRPLSALDPQSQEVECWTCGSLVSKQVIADRLGELQDLIDTKREERQRVDAELSEITEQRDEIRSQAAQKDELEARLADIDEQLERREQRIESRQQERRSIQRDIEELETHLEETEAFRESDFAERYQRLSDLEFKRGQLNQQLHDVEDKIARIERHSEERNQLTSQRDEIQDEIASLRSRIETIEQSYVKQFNERVSDILELLEYQNLERVWIERKTSSENHDDVTFELHVVREAGSGAVYEGSIDTLSESEREVIGLVIALAGYLVHGVHKDVPFMVLDSLEAIDATRINALIDYFADHVPYLIVALLPEDAERLETDYEQIPATSLAESGVS